MNKSQLASSGGPGHYRVGRVDPDHDNPNTLDIAHESCPCPACRTILETSDRAFKKMVKDPRRDIDYGAQSPIVATDDMPVKTVKAGKAKGLDPKQVMRPKHEANHVAPIHGDSIYAVKPTVKKETNRERRERLRKNGAAQGSNERNCRIIVAPMKGSPKRYTSGGIAPNNGVPGKRP